MGGSCGGFLSRLIGKQSREVAGDPGGREGGGTVLPCSRGSCYKNVRVSPGVLPSFSGSRVIATLSLPLPRLTR